MRTLWQDLRYGARVLRKSPGFTAVAVAALALGIGANTAIFSVVDNVLLRPLGYAEPSRLVALWEEGKTRGFRGQTELAPANYFDLREQARAFERVAAFSPHSLNLTGAGEPERLEGQRVSADLFPLLGVRPARGRWFLPEEDAFGADRAVVFSHSLWVRRFGADPALVGRTVALDGVPHTVVGVMPPHFHFPGREEFWVPMAMHPEEAAGRGDHYLRAVGRLREGVSSEAAGDEVRAFAERLARQYPETNGGLGMVVVPLHEEFVGGARPALLILLGAVGLVLLIACANVANLLLARAAARRREVAVRAALGAGRLRLVRQMLTESLLLATLGGAAGLLLAVWSVDLLSALVPPEVAAAGRQPLDARVLLFTLAVSLVTGVVFGLAPALQSSNPRLSEALKEAGRYTGSGAGRGRARGALVVCEVAVALMLVVGAGLLLKGFWRLRAVEPGFRAEGVLTMKVILPAAKYAKPEQRRAFYDETLRRVAALPGVESAAMISFLPLTFRGMYFTFTAEGRPPATAAERPNAVYRVVSPDYFRAMGVPVLRGRAFAASDTAEAPAVMVVSRAMAERHWPGEDPIGRRLKVGPPDSRNPWATVVGVVGDVRHGALSNELEPEMYAPYAQETRGFTAPRDLVVRTSAGDPLSLAAAVREAVWSVDKDQPVSGARTLEQVLGESVARQRLYLLLLGAFAGLALVLAAVGVYGVMSYAVAQRTHEIGVRVALGAGRADILRLVVGQGMLLGLAGVGVGLAGAFALTRVMSSLLYGVTATDPAVYASVALLITLVALLACYVPARRAMKVDPMEALRYE
jgi:putative ABC transport system permease protein